MATRLAPRPSSAHGLIQATERAVAHWCDDLAELLSEAQRWCPERWTLSLSWGRLFSDQKLHWTAGWCPALGPGEDSLWADGDTASEAVARLLDRLGSLPRDVR